MSQALLSSEPAVKGDSLTGIGLIELDPNVHSIALIRNGHIVKTIQNRKRTSYDAATVSLEKSVANADTEEIYVVTDLLNGFWYLLAPGRPRHRLLLALREGQLVVNVESGSDLTEVAETVRAQLAASGAHFI